MAKDRAAAGPSREQSKVEMKNKKKGRNTQSLPGRGRAWRVSGVRVRRGSQTEEPCEASTTPGPAALTGVGVTGGGAGTGRPGTQGPHVSGLGVEETSTEAVPRGRVSGAGRGGRGQVAEGPGDQGNLMLGADSALSPGVREPPLGRRDAGQCPEVPCPLLQYEKKQMS